MLQRKCGVWCRTLWVLVVCKRMGRHAAVVANHCTRLMFSRRIVQWSAKVGIATRYCAFGRTFRPSGGADGCNQARFADDVHHPCEVIGENMQRHLGGDVP